jgi:hypothetical protein
VTPAQTSTSKSAIQLIQNRSLNRYIEIMLTTSVLS